MKQWHQCTEALKSDSLIFFSFASDLAFKRISVVETAIPALRFSSIHDKFAVGVYRTNPNENELVGHLPAEFSRIAAYFIQNGGEIFCKVTGKRVHSKGPRGGLAIPCKLHWTSSNKKHVRRLDKLIATETSKIRQRYGLV